MPVSTLATTSSYLGGSGFLLGSGSLSTPPGLLRTTSALLTQHATEALVSGTPSTRLTQHAVEALVSGTSVARITQHAVEVLTTTVGTARVSQAGVEVLAVSSASVRVSQAGVEVLARFEPSARISQIGLEVVTPARIRFVIATATLGITNGRFINNNHARFLVTRSRAIIAHGTFVQANFRSVPAHVVIRTSLSRTITGNRASLGSPTHTRTITTRASWFARRSRAIIANARLGTRDRTLIAHAQFHAELGRVIFCQASIGYRRSVPAVGQFLGFPARSIPAWTQLRATGVIPCRASFWSPAITWDINSDSQTRVMSMASRLIGGHVVSYLGLVPGSANGAIDPNWQLPSYNDSFWQPPASTTNDLIPFPSPNSSIRMLGFNWSWPNQTNDDARGPWVVGPSPEDPSFGTDLFRRSFGLPLDPAIVAATSGQIVIGVREGVFIAQISASINGHPLPLLSRPLTNPAAIESIYSIPSSVLLPGNNTLAISDFTYLNFGLLGRRMAFILTFNYQPRGFGLPQVIS